MSEAKPRTVKVTRAQALAAQLIEKLDRKSGTVTDLNVKRVADAGRNAGVILPDSRSSDTAKQTGGEAVLPSRKIQAR
jgi:hypothetical protein